MRLLTFSKVLGPIERCGRCGLGFSTRPGCSLCDAIEGNENEVVAGADTGYEEGSISVEAGASFIDNDDIERFRCGVWILFGVSGGDDDIERLRSGVWISFGVSGGDNIVISCSSDSGEWTSSALR